MLIEFSVLVERGIADALSDHLLDAGAVSVMASDADADSLDEQPIYGEPGQASLPPPVFGWQKTRLVVMMNCDAESAMQHFSQANLMLASAAENLPQALALRLTATDLKPVDDQDWVRLTQQQFEPILIGKTLAIAPSWHLGHAAIQGRSVVELDPGLAFGTGSHPTTHLCLQWLEDHALSNEVAPLSVLDYGCGSGVLAIAAIKLGYAKTNDSTSLNTPAPNVCGIDIDTQAVTSTLENAKRNNVVLIAHDTSSQPAVPADIVVANILSNPLKVLAPLLSGLIKPGGYLVISGVLARQVDEVRAAYPAELNLSLWREHDGWACLVGNKLARK